MSNAPVDAELLLAALEQRLLAAAGVLVPEAELSTQTNGPGNAAAGLLPALVEVIQDKPSDRAVWLLLVAVQARFPDTDQVLELKRSLELDTADAIVSRLLGNTLRGTGSELHAELRIVSDSVVVEVHNSSGTDRHTGIQRVVREVVPRWAAGHALILSRWTDGHGALRQLRSDEVARVMSFGDPAPNALSSDRLTLVAPWETTVVFPDVPVRDAAPIAAAMARFSGNRVSHIGYDLIPITEADLRPPGEANTAALSLVMVKHSHRVAGISLSAASEFQGFVDALPAQGLVGPAVGAVPLPTTGSPLLPGPDALKATSSAIPVIVCTGMRQPHKNHATVLFAAERLWQEGLAFELRMIGGAGWDDSAYDEIARRLRQREFQFVELGRVSEQRLWDELRAADVSVFISLHEGFGLPIVESLSVGTPVMTTGYGSQAEVAADGGCLLVDPRDDESVIDGLRRLVTDGALRDRLRAEAVGRPARTWDDYAAEAWHFLVSDGEGS